MENQQSYMAVVARWLFNALFPQYCVRCDNEGHVLCPRCRLFWIPEPILERFSHDTRSVHGIFSMSPYPDPVVKGLLRRWKYHGEEKSGEMLLWLLQETLEVYQDVLPSVDAIAFVPLHRLRRNERGFDQAEQLAHAVSEILGKPLFSGLMRVQRTTQQATLSDELRLRAIEPRAFSLQRDQQELPKRLLLIDDVWTTGTTLRAAAQVLRRGGAEEVWAFTLARG